MTDITSPNLSLTPEIVSDVGDSTNRPETHAGGVPADTVSSFLNRPYEWCFISLL